MTSPVNYVDPTGHMAVHDSGGGSSVVVVPEPDKKPMRNSGAPHDTDESFPSAESLLNVAIGELANPEKENKGGNKTKYGKWYGTNGVPWCAQFVSY